MIAKPPVGAPLRGGLAGTIATTDRSVRYKGVVSDDFSLYDRLTRVGSVERMELFADWWDSGEEVPVAEFYAALRLVWSSAEFLYRYDDVWPDLWCETAVAFGRDPGSRAMFMTAAERKTYSALPANVTIYRGRRVGLRAV